MEASPDKEILSAPATNSGGWPALAALVAGNVLLAFGPWTVRLADAEAGVGPVASAFWRVALAAPVLILLSHVGVRRPFRIAGGLWLVLGAGGLFFAADLAMWHGGILRTRLANATLFGNVSSLLFPLYGFLLARRWPERGQAAALALAAAGAALLLGRSYQLSPEHLLGDALCLAAGVSYVGYLIAMERGRGVLAPLPTLTVATLAAIPPLWLAALLLEGRIMPEAWGPLLLLAGGSQVLGQGLMVYAIGRLSTLVVGIGLLLQPVVAAAIGGMIYGERIGLADAVGAAAIGLALVLVRRGGKVASG